MDITNSAQRWPGYPVIGKVNGEEITLTEFNNTQQVLYSNSGADIYNQRSYLWELFRGKIHRKDRIRCLWLGVGDVELEDLQTVTILALRSSVSSFKTRRQVK
ncbi:MAG: hypothetical protein H6561_21120 [Lewinellaceae bacterium]|nr:hypothetical protein [Lewinellaceae bacterium]